MAFKEVRMEGKHRRTLLAHPKIGRRFFASRIRALLRHPLFAFLTVTGNGFAVIGAVAFYSVENEVNPHLLGWLDALWWSMQTVTTVGYGDIFPVTPLGKCIGIFLMLFGTALFSAFTALFATILLEPEISEVEEEVRELERTVRKS
jgi:voltage-gated potassium channel